MQEISPVQDILGSCAIASPQPLRRDADQRHLQTNSASSPDDSRRRAPPTKKQANRNELYEQQASRLRHIRRETPRAAPRRIAKIRPPRVIAGGVAAMIG